MLNFENLHFGVLEITCHVATVSWQ